MDLQVLLDQTLHFGAMHAHPVEISSIRFYPELRQLCTMNSCGCYGTNWGCPPGCGEIEALSQRLSDYQTGAVYQYIGTLEDSFDFEGMMACGKVFADLTLTIKDYLRGQTDHFLVLGAGKCAICDSCTYPDAPCRFPDRCNTSVEAYGINVSELCALAGLNYINGQNTVTNTGLILF